MPPATQASRGQRSAPNRSPTSARHRRPAAAPCRGSPPEHTPEAAPMRSGIPGHGSGGARRRTPAVSQEVKRQEPPRPPPASYGDLPRSNAGPLEKPHTSEATILSMKTSRTSPAKTRRALQTATACSRRSEPVRRLRHGTSVVRSWLSPPAPRQQGIQGQESRDRAEQDYRNGRGSWPATILKGLPVDFHG